MLPNKWAYKPRSWDKRHLGPIYSLPTQGTSWTWQKFKGLINCQKKCLRNINKSKYNSYPTPIFKKSNILKFKDLFHLNCKLFMHSFVHNKHPSCFESMFKKSNSLRTNNIALQICKKSSLRNLPSLSYLVNGIH